MKKHKHVFNLNTGLCECGVHASEVMHTLNTMYKTEYPEDDRTISERIDELEKRLTQIHRNQNKIIDLLKTRWE